MASVFNFSYLRLPPELRPDEPELEEELRLDDPELELEEELRLGVE